MGRGRFDASPRAFGAGRSRRGVLKGLGVAALGVAGVGRLGAPAVAAGVASTADQEVSALLNARPLAPSNHNRFNPQAYPDAAPMQPAQGSPMTVEQARDFLQRYVQHRFPGDAAAQQEATALFDHPDVVKRMPDSALRIALIGMKGTLAEPGIDYFLSAKATTGTLKVATVKLDDTGVLVPKDLAMVTKPDFSTGDNPEVTILVNKQYAAENPLLLVGVLAHEFLHSDLQNLDYEEAICTTVTTLTYLQQLAVNPELAATGTQLSRILNTNAAALLNTGLGTRLQLKQSNGNKPVLPGSTYPQTSWWAVFANLPGLAPTPGNELLRGYLPFLPSRANFDQATVDSMDQHVDLLITDADKFASANALGLEADDGYPNPPPGS